jgi:hypothetical protein
MPNARQWGNQLACWVAALSCCLQGLLHSCQDADGVAVDPDYAPCCLQGLLHSCQDADGVPVDPDYVLPPGQQLTRQWCTNDSLVVESSAYHAVINVSVPPYTPQLV